MFNPDLLTPSERQEILDLCASIQRQCAELKETLNIQDAAVNKVLTMTKEN